VLVIPKRLIDLLITVPGLAAVAPVMIVAALMVKFGDGGPVFFRQTRVGRGGRPFAIWKFRTFVCAAEAAGLPITIGSDPRITRTGQYLRRYKIDELPQLFNVLAGDMSLVGPRPEVPCIVATYGPEQRKVLEYLPGITDPASIEYRNEAELLGRSSDPRREYLENILPRKLAINLDYASRAGAISDLRVILRTVCTIFTR
jgi:lipopolysaccharide/colanic/teichoic acid biosynthesis glycosyltransferase